MQGDMNTTVCLFVLGVDLIPARLLQNWLVSRTAINSPSSDYKSTSWTWWWKRWCFWKLPPSDAPEGMEGWIPLISDIDKENRADSCRRHGEGRCVFLFFFLNWSPFWLPLKCGSRRLRRVRHEFLSGRGAFRKIMRSPSRSTTQIRRNTSPPQSNTPPSESTVPAECFIALLIHVSFAVPGVSVLRYTECVSVCVPW